MDDTLPQADARPKPSFPSLYPWYVHLLSGYVLTGAFCWLLVAGCFWRCGRRVLAGILMGINAILLSAMIFAALRLEMAWWHLNSLILGLNLFWALSAWLVQHRIFGPAEHRYHLIQWRRWMLPMTIGALLGLGFAISLAVSPAIGDRILALYKERAVLRSSVLWQFFRDLPMGLALGLLAGMWWAGCRHFTISHVVGFLGGIAVVLAAQMVLFAIFGVIINEGDMANLQMLSHDAWSPIADRLWGWQRVMGAISDFQFIAFIPIGMLFGAPERIRDFLKRCAWVVPALMLVGLPLSFFSHESWALIQGRLVYRTASALEPERKAAFDRLNVLLARYPDHAKWPYLAARLADFKYLQGKTEASRKLHQQIVNRFSSSNQWHTQVALSRSIIASPGFGQAPYGPSLTIPMVNYQDYLTQNWMALLAAVRYWQGNETPVSELLIRLRDISKSDDYIQLPRLTSLADLDDAAFGLGYSLTILPADPSAARRLIEAGIPVLLPVYQTFYLIYGFDDSRGIVNALCFGQLSEKTQSLAVKEAQEVLMLESEGQGRTKDQLSRIKREAECMWHLSHWQTGRLQDAAPFMAAIHPEDGRKAVAAALGRDAQDLTVSHRGLLSALIALSHFDAADPINCIRWSQIASGSIDDPLVWQTAYLGATLWQHRTQRIGSALQLEKRFALLNEVNQFLQTESVKRLLDTATEKFAEDLAADRLNWPIRWRLLWLLDRNDAHQRRQMVSLLNANLATHPADAAQWRLLADLQALNHNPDARAQALAQAWSADPRDPATALSWASACILLDDPVKADQILAKIDPAKVRHQADYFFCRAAVAEWKHQPKAALRYYAKATDMCRYRSEYYLRYGRLLLAQGDAAAGKKAMAWAARIDSGEKIGQAATHDPEPQAR